MKRNDKELEGHHHRKRKANGTAADAEHSEWENPDSTARHHPYAETAQTLPPFALTASGKIFH